MAIAKLNYDVNSKFAAQVGVDWRTVEIYHVKTIRDLLGGDINTDSDFLCCWSTERFRDPIDYNM